MLDSFILLESSDWSVTFFWKHIICSTLWCVVHIFAQEATDAGRPQLRSAVEFYALYNDLGMASLYPRNQAVLISDLVGNSAAHLLAWLKFFRWVLHKDNIPRLIYILFYLILRKYPLLLFPLSYSSVIYLSSISLPSSPYAFPSFSALFYSPALPDFIFLRHRLPLDIFIPPTDYIEYYKCFSPQGCAFSLINSCGLTINIKQY